MTEKENFLIKGDCWYGEELLANIQSVPLTLGIRENNNDNKHSSMLRQFIP